MTKQTVGFNVGAGGTSCSVWKGVPLRYILEKAGILSESQVCVCRLRIHTRAVTQQRIECVVLHQCNRNRSMHNSIFHTNQPIFDNFLSVQQGAKHVCFSGADKLPNGCYGTVSSSP